MKVSLGSLVLVTESLIILSLVSKRYLTDSETHECVCLNNISVDLLVEIEPEDEMFLVIVHQIYTLN